MSILEDPKLGLSKKCLLLCNVVLRKVGSLANGRESKSFSG
jgi:hypothetical protein